MKKVVIVGASGHGSVVLDCILRENQYSVVGYIDSFQKKGRVHNGFSILGTEYDLPYLMEKFDIHGGIVAIGDNWIRKQVVDRIVKIAPDFEFVSAVHPNATVGANVQIGKGTVIMPGVIVNSNSTIGDYCILNTNSSLDHDGFMDDYSSLAPRVCVGGVFSLGKYSAVCLGTNVIENVSIGNHTVIGAGSLVINDFGDQVVVYESPARVIRKRVIGEEYLNKNKPLKVISYKAK
ncbi:MAG: acetyltransferase [Flavobacteriaceae bacterium]